MASILVLQPEPSIARIIQQCLAQDGHQVFIAESLPVADAQTLLHLPKLVFIDTLTVGLTQQWITDLRHVHPQVVIILMSVDDPIDLQRIADELLVDDYLVEPFDPETLCELVGKFLEG